MPEVSSMGGGNGRPLLIRIKRRLDEDPLENLVLLSTGKRARLLDHVYGPQAEPDENNKPGNAKERVFRLLRSAPISSVLQPDDVLREIDQIEKLQINVNGEQPKQHSDIDRLEKKGETQPAPKFRVIGPAHGRERQDRGDLKRSFAVIDIERKDNDAPANKKPELDSNCATNDSGLLKNDQMTVNGIPMIRTADLAKLSLEDQPSGDDATYLVDYYYQTTHPVVESAMESMVRIETFDEDLELVNEYDSSEDEEETVDEDSNEESNWRNDYPDEDAAVLHSSDSDCLENSDSDASDIAYDNRLYW